MNTVKHLSTLTQSQQLFVEYARSRGYTKDLIQKGLAGTMYAVASLGKDEQIIPEVAEVNKGHVVPILYLIKEEAFNRDKKLSLQHYEWYEDFNINHQVLAVHWSSDDDLLFYEVEVDENEPGRFMGSMKIELIDKKETHTAT